MVVVGQEEQVGLVVVQEQVGLVEVQVQVVVVEGLGQQDQVVEFRQVLLHKDPMGLFL